MSNRHDTAPAGVTFGHLADDDRKRAPIRRTGKRDKISSMARHLVYRRDGYRCQKCGTRQTGPMHLDHIVPWSAGGSDRTDNLRTLCGPCNKDRSNFVTGRDKPSLPIVRNCAPCLAAVHPGIALVCEQDLPRFAVYCGTHGGPGWVVEGWHIL